jgi:hypothetical protein
MQFNKYQCDACPHSVSFILPNHNLAWRRGPNPFPPILLPSEKEHAKKHFQKSQRMLTKCGETASHHIHVAASLGYRPAIMRLGIAHCFSPWDFDLGPHRSLRYGKFLLAAAEKAKKRTVQESNL